MILDQENEWNIGLFDYSIRNSYLKYTQNPMTDYVAVHTCNDRLGGWGRGIPMNLRTL